MSKFFPPPKFEFEEDIFISYAHVDNRNLRGAGWVDFMHESLSIRLHQLLGEEPEIWRDKKLRGNDDIQATIILKLSRIVFLISILSPRYIKSTSCLTELGEFYRRAAANGGILVDNKSRIFKVLKTPIEDSEYPSDYPAELRKLLGYEFYEVDQASQNVREFQPEYGQDSYVKFMHKLDDLAWDIRKMIRRQLELIRNQEAAGRQNADVDVALVAAAPSPVRVAAAPSRLTVYLAETAPELSEERNNIRRELVMYGHDVLPDEKLPLNAVDFEDAVKHCLSQSQMSVHLLGATYDAREGLAGRSVEQLQYDLAARHAGDPKFSKLVWTPRDLGVQEESQQRFLRHVQKDSCSRPGDEFLQTKLEDLKTVIRKKVRTLLQPPPPAPDVSPELIRLYVICDRQDLKAAAKLRDLLFEYSDKFEVTLPPQDGDAEEVAGEERASLLECDAAIIFYDQVRELWLRQKFRELHKINGKGRVTPLLAKDKAVYVLINEGDPKAEEKESYATREAEVAKNRGQISLEPLKSFLKRILEAKGGGDEHGDLRRAG